MTRHDLNNPDAHELERGDALRDEIRDRKYLDQLEQRGERRRSRETSHTGILVSHDGHQAAITMNLQYGDTGTRLFASRSRPTVDNGGITIVVSGTVSRESIDRAIRTLQDLRP